MDLTALDSRRLLYPVILLLLAGTKQVAATSLISYTTDNEGLPPCFPEEFFNQVRCCDRVDSLQDSLQQSRDSVDELKNRLGDVTSIAQNAIVNVSAQSSQLSNKLSETFSSFINDSLENYEDRQRAAEKDIARLRSESHSLTTLTGQVQQKLDKVEDDWKRTKESLKGCSQITREALGEDHSRLNEEVEEANINVEDLEESMDRLKKKISEVGTKMTTAEDDLQRLTTAINNLCLPPFSWQGDGCYYLPYLKKTWQKSRDFCINLGADLVVPRKYEEFIGWVFSLKLDDDIWVGASDMEEEGNWTWINGDPLNIDPELFFNWKQDTKDEEDCLEICTHTQNRPTDYDCEHENFFVCQKSIKTEA